MAESLEDIPALEQKFADPKQRATHSAEQLPEELIQQLHSKVKALRLDQIEGFLPGITAYLSEPKPQAVFKAPKKPLNPNQFERMLQHNKLTPHPQSRILSHSNQIYCNGENMTKGQNPTTIKAWQKLAAFKGFKGKIQLFDNSSLYEAYQAG